MFPLLEVWKMKKGNKVGVWRPAGGAVLVGALAFAVGAYAAPRTADKSASRGSTTTSVRSDSALLVTGSPEQVQSVVAGTPPVARLKITPRPIAQLTAAQAAQYPAGSTVVGDELSAFNGGFRAWFNFQAGEWDPNGDANPVPPGTAQVKLDAMGYMDADTSDPGTGVGDDGDQDDLTTPVIACANNGGCITAFEDVQAVCEGGFCKPAFDDKDGNLPSPYCQTPDEFAGFGACDQADCATAVPNISCFAITPSAWPNDQYDGSMRNFATLIIDIPANAKGRYTVNLLTDESFLATSESPPVQVETLSETGFTVNIVTGACCSEIGTPGVHCTEGLTQAECNAETAPVFWQPNLVCPAVCIECAGATQAEADALCNDNDACSVESCNTGVGLCVRGCKPGWDPGTECCDPATGTETPLDDSATAEFPECTVDTCSGGAAGACNASGPGNGTAVHTPDPGAACDDNNGCTRDDLCQGDGSCQGSPINGVQACDDAADCLNGGQTPPGICNLGTGLCTCSLVPDGGIGGDGQPLCDGGPSDGEPCVDNGDCPGGTCDPHPDGANCYDAGEKVSLSVGVGQTADPINGGQFLLTYDPSCLDYQSVSGVAPYSTTVYGPVVNESAGSIFIAVGVNPFGGADGPAGGVDMLSLSFRKLPGCDNCDVCFGDQNPQNTYLVDNSGQRVEINGNCTNIGANGDLELDVPGNIKTNVDCDSTTAVETWDAPSASFTCGEASLTCRGAHESGANFSGLAMGGGQFPIGATSFCCYAEADHKCDAAVGCPGAANDCAIGSDGKPVGCWTVTVNDETSLDIDVQLEPPITHDDAGGQLTRCIKFCLYANCIEEPTCFSEDVEFGGLTQFTGKAGGKIKVPGAGQWDCITAQDQFHTLRSCYLLSNDDCVNGQLSASFEGDPRLGGNWLIAGNLDGWKKNDGDPSTQPSLDVIDILDFGTFVSQFNVTYADNDTPCGTAGPNADINGDGDVTMADYNKVLANFLVSSKECCCGPEVGGMETAPVPITEISVNELRQLGHDDLVGADLNGDGLVNGDDMDAFMQGVRPTKTGNGRGGKGLRSGR
jgi:hypothetical protein